MAASILQQDHASWIARRDAVRDVVVGRQLAPCLGYPALDEGHPTLTTAMRSHNQAIAGLRHQLSTPCTMLGFQTKFRQTSLMLHSYGIVLGKKRKHRLKAKGWMLSIKGSIP